MKKTLRTLGAVVVLASASSFALADAKSHAADAERFLKLANADKLTTPVYDLDPAHTAHVFTTEHRASARARQRSPNIVGEDLAFIHPRLCLRLN